MCRTAVTVGKIRLLRMNQTVGIVTAVLYIIPYILRATPLTLHVVFVIHW